MHFCFCAIFAAYLTLLILLAFITQIIFGELYK
jgi:hypothetical protein